MQLWCISKSWYVWTTPAGPIGYMSTSDSRTQPTSVGNKKIGYERRLRGHPEVRHRSEETVMAIYDESKFLY